eukprot:6855796-Prymnesium_polylepis.1
MPVGAAAVVAVGEVVRVVVRALMGGGVGEVVDGVCVAVAAARAAAAAAEEVAATVLHLRVRHYAAPPLPPWAAFVVAATVSLKAGWRRALTRV